MLVGTPLSVPSSSNPPLTSDSGAGGGSGPKLTEN
jgi:hypothetical protein